MEDFKRIRKLKHLNRLAQVVLALGLLIAINLISNREFARIDMTKDNRYSLSAETLAYIDKLEKPVKIILSKPSDKNREQQSIVYNDIKSLLREYVFAGQLEGRERVEVEEVDLFRQQKRTAELVEQYGLNPQLRNLLMVVSGERHTEIDAQDLYQENEDTGVMRFTGERAVTSAILNVSTSEKPVIYFLYGHGEMQAGSVDPMRGMSAAATYLQNRNWEIRPLQLVGEQEVPEDAALVVIASPVSPVLSREVRKLERYLAGGGRVIALLDPVYEHGLNDLLYEWGLRTEDMLIIETDPNFVYQGGDMLIGSFAEHPVVDVFRRDPQFILMGLTRPVVQDLTAPPDETLKISYLMGTSSPLEGKLQSWGERSYRRGGSPRFDANEDLAGPVPVAAIADRSGTSDVGIERPGGRLAVIGNASFVSNSRFVYGGNVLLFHTLVNWMAERDKEFLQIRPKEWQQLQAISEEQVWDFWKQLLPLPAGLLLAGGVAAVMRRR